MCHLWIPADLMALEGFVAQELRSVWGKVKHTHVTETALLLKMWVYVPKKQCQVAAN